MLTFIIFFVNIFKKKIPIKRISYLPFIGAALPPYFPTAGRYRLASKSHGCISFGRCTVVRQGGRPAPFSVQPRRLETGEAG